MECPSPALVQLEADNLLPQGRALVPGEGREQQGVKRGYGPSYSRHVSLLSCDTLLVFMYNFTIHLNSAACD